MGRGMCMKKQTLVRDATVMLLALFAAYAMVMLTQAVMGRIEGVAMLIFMLAVFVTSMYTEGYMWGVAASLISVLAVNFAFLSPYFAFNFTLSENLFSGLVMLVVSIMTSTLTTRIKKQEQLRMESEKEKMRANLLRAVSHDLRTPLTSIYGACSTVIENYDSLDKEKTIKLLGEACSDAQWLTAREYKILEYLMHNIGRVLSSAQIYEAVWNEPAYGTEKTVTVHIRNIREKIEINPKEPKYLKVVYGLGYKVEKC